MTLGLEGEGGRRRASIRYKKIVTEIKEEGELPLWKVGLSEPRTCEQTEVFVKREVFRERLL